MNSFCHKRCQGIGQGDPEKCKSLCIHCSNVPFTEKLNELQTKKRELYLQNKEKTNLVLKRKNAKLKGQESSRDITANLEMSV